MQILKLLISFGTEGSPEQSTDVFFTVQKLRTFSIPLPLPLVGGVSDKKIKKAAIARLTGEMDSCCASELYHTSVGDRCM